MTFEEARALVLSNARRIDPTAAGATEPVRTLQAFGRILAENVPADRDYPPFARSARDGFAVRAADLPGELAILGEVRAGQVFEGSVAAGEAVEIMTGAPLPEGADAVVMVEHVERSGNRVKIDRALASGENVAARATEAAEGSVVVQIGRRLGFAEIAALAMVGRDCVPVFRRPRVAILPTGDEIVGASQKPETHQIRNSNAWSLAVQVKRAGGRPVILPIARDNYESTGWLIERGLEADLLLLSGGVSAGKYDIVEKVLAGMGAEFYFDRVKIQPGQPVVFGAIRQGPAKGKQFFGLPGNPASTMVTFEIFARAAVEFLSGADAAPLPLLRAKLTREFRHKPGLTRFLPATLSADGSTITPEPWQGSGDIPSLARTNAFLVAEADRECWAAGEDMRVLAR